MAGPRGLPPRARRVVSRACPRPPPPSPSFRCRASAIRDAMRARRWRSCAGAATAASPSSTPPICTPTSSRCRRRRWPACRCASPTGARSIRTRRAAQIVVQRAAYQFAHKIVANSRAAADRLRLERVPAGRVATVSNGVDSSAFAAARPRRPLRRVTVVANLRPEKGHDVLIDAAPEVLRHFPDAPLRHRRRRTGARSAAGAARRLRACAHAFTFAGYEPKTCRSGCRTRTSSSCRRRSEAFPNAVLEAMSAGLPIVASGVGGMLELVDDGRTGLLVPPGDPHALAHGICRLMADRAARRASRQGRVPGSARAATRSIG